MWYHIPNHLLNQVGGVEFLLTCDFEEPKVPIKPSNFHKQALHYKHDLFKHFLSTQNYFME